MPKKSKSYLSRVLIAAITASWAIPASAHPGHDEASTFAAGFVHPFSGADHMLAMILAGIMAAMIGGRRSWLVPASFLSMLATGMVIGANAPPSSLTEFGIVGSVFTLAALVTLRMRLPLWVATALVGFFALFHGFAHITEIPANSERLLFGWGVVTATGLLLLCGMLAGLSMQNWFKAKPRFAA